MTRGALFTPEMALGNTLIKVKHLKLLLLAKTKRATEE